MNEKVLILLNTTILTENTELGDEGVEDKKNDEVSSADGCDGLGGDFALITQSQRTCPIIKFT